MNRRFVEKIRQKIPEYEKKILEEITSFQYQKERYNVDYTIAVGATIEDVEMQGFSQIIRKTDAFIYLDKNICCIVFAFNDPDQGVKAASNMLNKFEMQYFSKKIFLGIVNSQDEENATIQIKKLFETLCFGILNGMSNIPLDYNEIDSQKAMS